MKNRFLTALAILACLIWGMPMQAAYHVPFTVSQSMYNDNSFKVGTNGDNSWSNGGVMLGSKRAFYAEWQWGDKYATFHFNGIPDKLSFDYCYGYVTSLTKNTAVGVGQSTDPNQLYFLFVEESSDGNTWTALPWQNTEPSDSWKASGNIQLNKSTRYLRFHLNANLAAYYKNIKVTELKYVEDPVPATIDLGTAAINAGEVSATTLVNWCNIAPMTVTSSNDKFTVSPTSFGGIDAFGSQVLTIRYVHGNEVGANAADITISNGTAAYTKTIHVTAETTKRPQTIVWNEQLSATGFAMNVDEFLPNEEIPVPALTTNGERITYSSDNTDVIEVINDTILLAKAVGTAHITASQAGDGNYASVSDTQLFTVTSLLKQAISWEQNLYGLLTTDGTIELTATATSTGAIRYVSADENVVRIQGSQLIIVGEGETTVTAYQDGGEINGENYLAVSQTNTVIVRNPASQCNERALTVNSLTLSNGSLSREYNLTGTPQTLTFSAYHGKNSNWSWGTGVTYASLIVEQYACIDNLWGWYQVYNKIVGTDATASGNITLNETATKIRFITGETVVSHTINNISVTRKKYMRADVEAVDLEVESNATWQKTITVSHSNIDLMTVTAKQGLISLSTTILGSGCGDFGDDAFTATFTPMQKYVEYLDTIVITDAKQQPTTIEIPVRFYTTGLNQMIQGYDLPERAMNTDLVELHATATSGLEVIYLSSDSTVAYVENNILIMLKAGTVDITAMQPGNEKYNDASETKTIVIKAEPVAQQILWNEEMYPVAKGDTREFIARATSGLDITYSSSDNSIAYMEGNVLHAVAAGTVTITATQAGNEDFLAAEPVTKQITITDIEPIEPDLYLDPLATEITYGQPLSESVLYDYEASVPGVFQWVDGTQILPEGTQYANAVFVPEDMVNYKPFYIEVEVTVLPAPQTPTAVENTDIDENEVIKVLRDGQIIIRRDSKEYDLNGHRL